MNITLKNFQLKALKQLMKGMEEDYKEIVLKSPTGSGKTIILTHFMDEYLRGNSNTIFMWLTPGKGNLEEQSKSKMDKYIHNAKTKLLSDVMMSGFEEDDNCFINWEKLTKKGNNALKDGERTNFLEHIEKALDSGLSFKIIIDESHQNFTEKSDAIIQMFRADKIIRCSATPLIDKNSKLIEVKEDDVIAEGLIKKMLVINEDFPQHIETENYTHYLLEKALDKQIQLRQKFLRKNNDVNPLIIVQLPNSSDLLLDDVENFFESKGINYENENLSLWLSGRHENLNEITKNNSKQIAVIIKQAVATGWDCPRAHILVKLRENMDETFEIQTIGRIRRMPQAKHYNNDLLDSCYLYTLDSKFTQGVKQSLGKGALNAKALFLKNEYKKIKLVKEQRTMIADTRDSRKALTSVKHHFKNKFKLTNNKKENKIRLESKGFIFSDSILRYTISGKVVLLNELNEKDILNLITLSEPINTHQHGREYHNRIARIGLEIGMQYSYINTIIGKLFGEKFEYHDKLLNLTTRELYAFVLNNFDVLRRLVRDSMALELKQESMQLNNISKKDFYIPQSVIFTFDERNKQQVVYSKNVYQGYLSSAESRSSSEKKFEKFCEQSKAVDWVYCNGDKGDDYFSIVYLDNSNRQKLFYPDYIISVNNKLWIIETKGGFDRSGHSEDIDIFSEKKFNVLKKYLKEHGLNGGFVRFDKKSQELYICTEKYNDDIYSDSWKLLSEVINYS